VCGERGERERLNWEQKELFSAVLANRQRFYDFLAGFYAHPLTQEDIEALATMDFAAEGYDESLIQEGFDDLRRGLRRLNTGTCPTLAIDYTSCFAGLESFDGRQAIPCASLFLDDAGRLYTEQQRAVHTFYKQQAWRLASSAGLPDDHLAFELTFLGVLSGEAIQQLATGETIAVKETLAVSRVFIENHILSWIDLFSELALKLLKTRFYCGVLKLTKGFVLFDLRTIADLEEELRITTR
jgi:TorA maturation chaperone TorD